MGQGEPVRQGGVSAVSLGLFGSLYALQGVVIAYFFNYNQLYMMAGGVAAPRAAEVQSLALLPFILKFLAGPLSDRVNLLGWGHRKPYIILGLLVQSAGLLSLSRIHPAAQLSLFTITAVATVAGLALYDTCCDGLVIDVTPAGDRERVQGVLVACRAVAAMVCSLGFGLLLERTGNGPGAGDLVLWICAALGAIPLGLALLAAEPCPAAGAADGFQWRALGALLRPRSLVLLAFGAAYSVVGYGVEINLSPFYGQDLQFRDGTIGGLASARYVGRAAGAAILASAAPRIGRHRVIQLGLLALAATTAAQASIRGPGSAGLAGLAFGAANGWMDALFFVLAMEASDPRMAASTYALFMAVTNISVTGGALVAWLENALSGFGSGYRMAFVVTGCLAVLAWPLIRFLSRPQEIRGPETQPSSLP